MGLRDYTGEGRTREAILDAFMVAWKDNDGRPITKRQVEAELLKYGSRYDLKSWFEALQELGYIERMGRRWTPTYLLLIEESK